MNDGSLEPNDALNLREYSFKPDYNTEDDDIVADFIHRVLSFHQL